MAKDDDLALALGRVVIASGRLEWTAYAVALSIGIISAPELSVTRALKLARRNLVADPPPWCTLTVEEFDRWRMDVVGALDQRNQLFHSVQVNRMMAGQWERAHLWLRDGSDVAATLDVIADIAEDIAAVDIRSPIQNLLPALRPGVYVRIVHAPGYEGGPFIYYNPATMSYPDTPTDGEMDAWWHSVSPEWHNWIIRKSKQVPTGGLVSG